MSEQVFNFKVTLKVSFGGPRDDRYFDIIFPHTMDFQLHVYRTYQKIKFGDGQLKTADYVHRDTGEVISHVSKKGILFFCSLGPLFFDPETIGFDMIGKNPLKN